MHISVNSRGRLALFAQCAGTLHATHELELEGDCARCDPARRHQGAISRARPARARSANRHLHGLLHRTRRTPRARGAPRAALRRSELLRYNQHYLRTMAQLWPSSSRATLSAVARSAKTAAGRARFIQMAHEYRLSTLRIHEELCSDQRASEREAGRANYKWLGSDIAQKDATSIPTGG